MYNNRLIDKKLKQYTKDFPAILVEGAKAVGKTASCMQIAGTSYSLDSQSANQLLKADPSIVLSDNPPVLLDEWQYAPELWTFVRHAVDNGLNEGSIIFTGSSPKVNAKIHSGAGRIVRLKMRPYSIEERGLCSHIIRVSDLISSSADIKISGKTDVLLPRYIDEIFKSGFPGIRNKKENLRRILLQGYVDNIIHHEFAENGFIIKKPQALLAWLKAYAASIATTTKFQTILEIAMADGAEPPSRPTAVNYRDALGILNIIEEVPAWLPIGKLLPNLGKTPKHFFLDPSLAICLLSVTQDTLLNVDVPKPIGKFNKTFVGQLFESLIYQSLIIYAENIGAELSHFRQTNGQHEIDFILQKGADLILFEVKTGAAVNDHDVRHLNWFEKTVEGEYHITKAVIYAGEFAYTRPDSVHIIPAAMLGA
jgi:predicted AAA+ superfamily ATPase